MAGSSAARRTFVVDTSVLLADPLALERFEEHDVVVPLVVISELEAKRHHPELGYMARAALRYLERQRTAHGTLTDPIPVGDGGTLRVELNHVDGSASPRADADRVQRRAHPRGGPPPRVGGLASVVVSRRTCHCGSRPRSSASAPRSTATSSPPTTSGAASSSCACRRRSSTTSTSTNERRDRRRRRPADPQRPRADRRLPLSARPDPSRQDRPTHQRQP